MFLFSLALTQPAATLLSNMVLKCIFKITAKALYMHTWPCNQVSEEETYPSCKGIPGFAFKLMMQKKNTTANLL